MSSGRRGVVGLQALEEEQQRMMPARFEFVSDWADLLQVAVRVGDANPCALLLAERIHGALAKPFF